MYESNTSIINEKTVWEYYEYIYVHQLPSLLLFYGDIEQSMYGFREKNYLAIFF